LIAAGDIFVRSRNPALDGAQSVATSIGPSAHYNHANETTKTAPKKQPTFRAHRGRANRAFADGHLEAEDMRRPFAASDAQLRRWNVDHEPHRDRLAD